MALAHTSRVLQRTLTHFEMRRQYALCMSFDWLFAPPSKQVMPPSMQVICVSQVLQEGPNISQHSPFQMQPNAHNNESHISPSMNASVIVNLQVVSMAMG